MKQIEIRMLVPHNSPVLFADWNTVPYCLAADTRRLVDNMMPDIADTVVGTAGNIDSLLMHRSSALIVCIVCK